MTRPGPRCCSYVVAIDSAASQSEIVSLSHSLSPLGSAGCEVLIFDASFDEERQRILRWVGRYEALPAGGDILGAAIEVATCEKIVMASPQTRCTPADIVALCAMLESHEVVEPAEFVAPLPWWGGVDAGGLLLHRGADQPPGVRSVFAFRKHAWRLVLQGADVHRARDLFIRREPPMLGAWFRSRGRDAASDFSAPVKGAFFFGLLPAVALLALAGGADLAGSYATVLTFASLLIAVRGRAGAGHYFPWRTCLYAPVWVVARSIAIYWALIEKMRAAEVPASISSPAQRSGPEKRPYTGEASPS